MKKNYICNECDSFYYKWQGQCGKCKSWDSLKEVDASISSSVDKVQNLRDFMISSEGIVSSIKDIPTKEHVRTYTGFSELDRVLGGGLVDGSVILLGGSPGAGKSTLLLQVLSIISNYGKRVLYVSAEESRHQIAMRAKRLGALNDNIKILIETNIELISHFILENKAEVVVIDSIQVMNTSSSNSISGSVSQVRESTNALSRIAKQNNISFFIVGHVTKDGSLAGPKVLEHCVDCSMIMEPMTDSRFRMIRANKNRFGRVNEIGIFAMDENGLKEVKNPSGIFLQNNNVNVSGSSITALWQGSRPLLVEVQSLVDKCLSNQPRRLSIGFDSNRLSMLLAVCHRHLKLLFSDQDVFVNIVGGVKTDETSLDMALVISLISSLKNKPFPNDTIVFGEIGLSGEVRPSPYGQERIREAEKHGFKHAIIPMKNFDKKQIFKSIEIISINNIYDILSLPFWK